MIQTKPYETKGIKMNAASKTNTSPAPAVIELECKAGTIAGEARGKEAKGRLKIAQHHLGLLMEELQSDMEITNFSSICRGTLKAVFYNPGWGALPPNTVMRAIAAPDVPKTDAVKLTIAVKNGSQGLEGLLIINGTTAAGKNQALEPAKTLKAVTATIKKLDARQWTVQAIKEVKAELKPTKANPTSSIVVPIFTTKPSLPVAEKPNTNKELVMVAKPAVKPEAEAQTLPPALSLQAVMALVTEQASILAKRDELVLQIQEKTRIENENADALRSLSQAIADGNARVAEITAQVDQLILEQEKLAQSIKENERKHHEMTMKSGGANLESLEKALAELPQFTPVEEAFIRPYIQKK